MADQSRTRMRTNSGDDHREDWLVCAHFLLRNIFGRCGCTSAFVFLISGSLGLQAQPENPETRPLLMLGDNNYPPIAFLRDGIAMGMDVDLVQALSRPMGREIKVQLMDWNLAQEKLEKGEADGLIGMSITSPRRKRFDFASPTFTREFSFLVRSGDLTLRRIDDLKDKKLGVTMGGFP